MAPTVPGAQQGGSSTAIMTTTDLINAELISEITQQLWSLVVPERGALEAAPLPRTAVEPAGEITARIEITGSWEGAVELRCSPAAGRRVAASMFALSEHEIDEIAVHDAVGELINIVGGNLKSLLRQPTRLSLPSVTESATPAGHPGRTAACEAAFIWMAEPVVVQVFEAG